jgi:archaellum component FlaC
VPTIHDLFFSKTRIFGRFSILNIVFAEIVTSTHRDLPQPPHNSANLVYNKGGVTLTLRNHMSPTNNPTVKDDDVTRSDNPADGKDALKELINNLAQEMRLGFAKIETQFADVKAEFADVKADIKIIYNKFDGINDKFDGVNDKFDGINDKFDGINDKFDGINDKFDGVNDKFDGINDKFDGINDKFDGVNDKFDGVNDKIEGKAKEITIELDKRASIIETKIDAQSKEMSILQQRVNSRETVRLQIITGLISASLGAILILTVQKLFSSEPPRNPTNRSAIEYIPEYRSIL